jgi:hypothetical protein
MINPINLSLTDVHVLAKVAGLPLSDTRANRLVPHLSKWLTAAITLNEKMSQPQYQEVTPITTFSNLEKTITEE